ncbi:MAG: DUF5695 domain-containing protein [Candidatus Aminicenantales bacterium]
MKHYPAIFRSIVFAAVLLAAPAFLLSGPGADDSDAAPQAKSAGPATSLSAGNMVVEFDRTNGVIRSITEKQGRFGTNYMGNPDNAPGTSPADGFWTGNIVSTAWELELPERPVVLIPSFSFRPSGKWRTESTGHSADIRKTSFDGQTFRVEYVGPSANEGGLKSYNLRMAYHFDENASLCWDVEIENTTGRPLEIGEFGFPLSLNDNYRGVRTKNPYTNTVDDHEVLYEDERQKLQEQPLIHEQRVVGHHYAGGHSSYTLVERLLGDSPYLLIHPAGDTPFECQYRYQDAAAAGRRGRGGATVMAVYSRAVESERNWSLPWVNGHTSLVLKPGAKKAFQIRFSFVASYAAIRDKIEAAGNLGIRVFPSMVIQEEAPVYVELRSKFDPEVSFLSDNCRVIEKKRLADRTLLKLAFKGRGQKTVRLTYDGGKWTNVHFYCTENTADLIDARARFIVDRQFYENPSDPYGRDHMFMPFNYQIGSIFTTSDSVYEVGGSDEYGFSEPVYLAEKNVYRPRREEVDKLEAYAVDCLMGHLQNQETFALRASLYWVERIPSSPWGHWTEERSKESYRTYNYPHAANIYHALYRIGKLYGLTSRRQPLEYLDLAYRTCLKWFETGPWKHVGVMCGSNAINILEDLKAEGKQKEYEALRVKMVACNDVFVQIPYPYSSELYVDQTAHEHVAFFLRYFGTPEKYRKTLQVIQALRGGNQPAWFRFGNDNRGDMACWYTESLNGMPLLKGFEETGDRDMLGQGYGGIMSVTANLLADGMGFFHFSSSPGNFSFAPLWTGDNGIGMYGYFKGIKAYAMKDEAFGLVGYGCNVEPEGDGVRAELTDGLRKRLMFADDKIDLEAVKGELKKVVLAARGNAIAIEAVDPTGLVDKVEIAVQGLEKGNYRITHGAAVQTVPVSGTLKIAVPVKDAGNIRIERIR